MELNDSELFSEIHINLNFDLFLIVQSYNRYLVLYLDYDKLFSLDWSYLVTRDLLLLKRGSYSNLDYMKMYLKMFKDDKNISVIDGKVYYNVNNHSNLTSLNKKVISSNNAKSWFEHYVDLNDIQWLKGLGEFTVYKTLSGEVKICSFNSCHLTTTSFLVDELYTDVLVSHYYCCLITRNDDIVIVKNKNGNIDFNKDLITEKNFQKILLSHNLITLWLTTGELVFYIIALHELNRPKKFVPTFNKAVKNCFLSNDLLCFQLIDNTLKFVSFTTYSVTGLEFVELKLDCLDNPFNLIVDMVTFEGWVILLDIEGKYQIIEYNPNKNRTYGVDKIYGDINKVICIKEKIAEIFSSYCEEYIIFRSIDNNFYMFEPISKYEEFMYDIGDEMYAKRIVLS